MMKLKYAIPFLGLTISCAIIGYVYVTLSDSLEQRERQFANYTLRNTANYLQGDLNDQFAHEDMPGVRRALEGIHFLSSTRLVYLLDDQDTIIASGQFDQVGEKADPVQHHYDREIFDKVRKSMSGVTLSKENGDFLVAVYPIVLGRNPGEFRPTRIGIAVIGLDVTENLKQIKKIVLKATSSAAAVVLIVLLAGILLVHFILTKRVQHILDATRNYMSGDSQFRSCVSGNDELGKISTAFNRVADSVEQAKAELHKNEERLRDAQRIAHLGSWQWNIASGQEVWSEEFYRIFGFDPDSVEPTFETFMNSLHPADLEIVQEAIDRSLRTKEPYTVQHRIIRPDGEERVLLEQGELVLNDFGEAALMNGTTLDITDRYRAEQEIKKLNQNLEWRVKERTAELQAEIKERKNIEASLKETEAKTRQIVNAAGDGIITTDQAGKMLSFNTSAEKIFGYSVVEVVGKNISMLMPQNIAEQHHRNIDNYLETGNKAVIGVGREMVAMRKGGGTFLADFSINDFRHGEEVTFVAIIRDITERKETEYRLNSALDALQTSRDEIQKNEHRLRGILNSSVAGITVVNKKNMHRVYANQRLLDMFGAGSLEEFEAFGFANTFANPDDHAQAMNMIKKLGGFERFMRERVRVDGSHWWAMQDASAITFEGEPSIIVWLYDITDQKHAEESLIEAEKMASLGSLVAGVAHEVNTPIGVGVTAVSHLKEHTDKLSKMLTQGELSKTDITNFVKTAEMSTNIIASNLRRASDLVRSFKQVAVDQSSEKIRTINLLDYIDEVLASLHPHLKSTRHKIVVEGDRNISITTQPGAISQVITNLVMNALIHAFDDKKEGNILIAANMAGQETKLTFEDDGKGMDVHVRSHIFDPFFTTKRGSGGSGLGMHVVYNQITQTLGGQVQCDSAPGKGTSFTIKIPLQVGALK